MLLSWSCWRCGVLARKLLFVYREGSRCASPCYLIVPACQMQFLLPCLRLKAKRLRPWSRITVFPAVFWWWLCCVLLGSEIIPVALHFCTEPCKGLLEWSVQGPWPVPLSGSEGGVSSGCTWANIHQQETWTALCLVSVWTEWRWSSFLQADKAQYWLCSGWTEV